MLLKTKAILIMNPLKSDFTETLSHIISQAGLQCSLKTPFAHEAVENSDGETVIFYYTDEVKYVSSVVERSAKAAKAPIVVVSQVNIKEQVMSCGADIFIPLDLFESHLKATLLQAGYIS